MCTWNLHNIAEPLYGINQKKKRSSALCLVLAVWGQIIISEHWQTCVLLGFVLFVWLVGWLFQHPRQVEVPRPGTELEPQPQPIPQL